MCKAWGKCMGRFDCRGRSVSSSISQRSPPGIRKAAGDRVNARASLRGCQSNVRSCEVRTIDPRPNPYLQTWQELRNKGKGGLSRRLPPKSVRFLLAWCRNREIRLRLTLRIRKSKSTGQVIRHAVYSSLGTAYERSRRHFCRSVRGRPQPQLSRGTSGRPLTAPVVPTSD
jgi:hypothetical protein